MRKVMIVEDEELILQGIKNIVHWNELELQLVNNIRDFLFEMGGDFPFIGNQYH